MKLNLFITLFFWLVALTSFSQTPPQAINYQAVVRDGNNQILTNQNVGIRFVVLEGSASGTVVYTETFDTTSNNYGLVNLRIGTGTTADIFADIDWASGPHYLETAMDITGGTNYVVLGTSQFVSVPYVFYAEQAGSVLNDSVIDADADPTNELQAISFSGDTLYLSNGGQVYLGVLQDGTGTDDQNISGSALNGTNLTIGIENGTSETIDLSSIDTQLTEAQVDQYVSNNGYITSPNDGDTSVTNELQAISFSNDTLYLSDGGAVYLGTLQDGTGTDDQQLMINGNQLSIESGNSITLPSSNLWTQSGSDIYYSGGNVGIDEYIFHNNDMNSYLGFPNYDDFELTLNGSNILTAGPGFFNSGELIMYPQNISVPNLLQGNLATDDRVVVASSNGGGLKTIPTSALSSGGSGLTGNGQANKMAFWDSPFSLTYATEVHYDSNWGRLGISNSNPQYELHVGGDISMNDKLIHNNDDNTFIEFKNDDLTLNAGGLAVLHAVESSQDIVYINSDIIRFNDVENTNGFVDVNCQTQIPHVSPGQSYEGKLGVPTRRWSEGHIWNVFYNSLNMVSDERVKKNITPLSSSLDRLLKVNLVHYDYIPELYYKTDSPTIEQMEESKNYTGVLAQEFEQIFPELVNQPENTDEYKSVNYVGLIPHLLKAIQEQQAEIEQLKAKLAE